MARLLMRGNDKVYTSSLPRKAVRGQSGIVV
jgi:hypothetical protein